jgi:hypothetical protein
MRKELWRIILTSIFFFMALYPMQAAELFSYIYPKPNSVMVPTETNLILRSVIDIKASTIKNEMITVIGSKSGIHKGDFLLSDDGKTLVFNPYHAFTDDEEVTVRLIQGLQSKGDLKLPEITFSFRTAPDDIVQIYGGVLADQTLMVENMSAVNENKRRITADLPAPLITIDAVNNPSPGYICMTAWDRNNPHKYGNFIFVLNQSGGIVDSIRVNGAPYDFTIQPNGLISYALGDFAGSVPGPTDDLRYYVLDNSLAVVDSFRMKNGYTNDFHELLILSNGHAMMMTYHTIIFDMSTVVPFGKTDASLVINVIQEQDLDKNVVFEWRNIDYIPITDSDLDLTAQRINYGTLNAFKVDDDGNILASFRNHSEIMKISRATGEVIWRMGGPRTDFTFIGENEENAPYYFARQHDIRRLPTGNITLFDNGEFHDPPFSRAVEYALDEVNLFATMVEEVRYPNGNIIAGAAGNAQKLPNDGWFLGYGILNPQSPLKRNAVEYHADGSVALEISLPANVMSYRTYKLPWRELVEIPSVTIFDVFEGNTYAFNNSSDTTGVTIYYPQIEGDFYPFATITRLPYGPVQPQFVQNVPLVYPVSFRYEGAAIGAHTSELHIDLKYYPEIKNPAKTVMQWREFPDQGLFIPLTTTYDSLANELIATTTRFGEAVFAETDFQYTANTPLPYEPLNKKFVLSDDSLTFRWTGQGFYDSFRLQVSTDSTFSEAGIDTVVIKSFLTITGLVNNVKYFWRIQSILGGDESDWSEVWHFETKDAFITVESPNGGEEWSKETTNIIRWESNIHDTVTIDLYLNQDNILSIGQTMASLRAFEWIIPSDLTVDSLYSLRMQSNEDSMLFDVSDSHFSISGVSDIHALNQFLPLDYSLSQNYPNPFNPTTAIGYRLSAVNDVDLSVYDILGRKIATLVSKRQPAGNYKVEWDAVGFASGIYYYKIEAGEFLEVKKMILIK